MHGFDKHFGYLYHLDAMSNPYWYSYPQDWIDKTGPRNLVHSWAAARDDATTRRTCRAGAGSQTESHG